MASMTVNNRAGEGWRTQHNMAVYQPSQHGETVAPMLRAWERYAIDHKARYGSPIGEDYVLGPEWKAIGIGIRGLLNGVCGRLDCGTLDAFILNTLAENGFDTEKL